MNLSHLTSDTLRNLIPLTEKRDDLIKSLRALENDIAAVLTGTATAVVEVVAPAKTDEKAAPKPASKARAGRGALKEQILGLLETAGTAGLGTKEIADKLGVKVGNIYVWFSSTGKALTSKVAPGRYAIKKLSAPVDSKKAVKKTKPENKAPAAKVPKPAAKPTPVKPVKTKRNISPEARAKMAAAAKTRWERQRAAKVASRPIAPVAAAKPAKPAKPAKAKKAGKPAKAAPKAARKGFKLPSPE